MRLAAVALLLIALGACAEVTTFRKHDGSVYYHVNCGDSLKLESCRHAAERTCPGGYTRVNVSASAPNDPTARCAAANRARQEDGEAPQPCPASSARDTFFACR